MPPILSILGLLWKERNFLLIGVAVAMIGFLHWRLKSSEAAQQKTLTALAQVQAQAEANTNQYNAIVKAVNEQQRGNNARQQQQQAAAAQLAQKRAKSLPMDSALSDAYIRLYGYQKSAGAAAGGAAR